MLAYLTGSELKALSWIKENYPKCVNTSTGMLRIFIKQISGTSGGKTLSRARDIRLSPTIMKIFERGFVLLEGYAGREGAIKAHRQHLDA